ncbi:MAG: FAD-binding protein [Acidimicrobiia bacterium]
MRRTEHQLTRLTGWGRTAGTVADVVRVDSRTITDELVHVGPRGALVRGFGRSYGDAAQNGGGTVLQLAGRVDDILLDEDTGVVTVPGGISLDELLRVVVPRGWFVPVTPGTRTVTMGGAIACDIHGKNHHSDGSFGVHVRSLTLLLSDGTTTVLTPESTPALFWATVGGMGLTGVILSASVQLLPIETSRLVVDTDRVANLDRVLGLMTEGDAAYRYSVAWIDLLAKGASLGRSVLTRGDHARLSELDPAAGASLQFRPSPLIGVPPRVPRVLNHLSVAAFNEVWYRKAPLHRRGEVQTISQFFHPLDAVRNWNRLYGAAGLVQYQFLVPFGEEDALRSVVERLAGSGTASFLAVLKRFGAGDAAPLSFPAPGWTLALDLPATRRVGRLLYDLDELVLGAGGRHYLAKDAHMTPAALRAGYPRLAEWQAIRAKADPSGVWVSDLARRLHLID